MAVTKHDHHAHHRPREAATVKDPVCGMEVDPQATEHHAQYGGKAYHFCSANCAGKFAADPERYLAPAPKAAARPTADADAVHLPDASGDLRDGPGTCPICGMALEPARSRRGRGSGGGWTCAAASW